MSVNLATARSHLLCALQHQKNGKIMKNHPQKEQDHLPLPEEECEAVYARGYQAFNDQHYDTAFACFSLLSLLAPQEPAYLFALACTLKIQGRHREALVLYHQCLELNPQDIWSWFHSGQCFQILRDVPRAVLAFQRTVQASFPPAINANSADLRAQAEAQLLSLNGH
ncbi:tetratricopeptide repeat protein [Pantoea sp. Acro-835]|uniref:Tetratricopeptide repeat protein n=2 Tax=Candidatus Pantoea multigeneris TaxID=2608357 RepID=A0ABX0R6J4_9GAMM|nr:tetratricopeptide repeat protein [Pantoea multigeneris]